MNFSSANSTILTLALCRFADVTPRMMNALLNHFGNLERIMKSDAGTLMSINGMTIETANKITQAKDQLDEADVIYTQLRERDIDLVSRFDDEYPQLLFELNDPPSIIYFRGRLPDPKNKIAGIVGSEKPSNEGIGLTTTLAKNLTENDVQIISSLNIGISIAAHLGSRSSNGISFAVLDSGFDNVVPEENIPVAIDIVKDGGLITEYPPDVEYNSESYKTSNRIVAAMAQAIVLTEFYADSEIITDLLECCSQIGKLLFILIDPKSGALTDEDSLNKAVSCGAIPIVGCDKIDDITKSLV
jgi:DNA processing protein